MPAQEPLEVPGGICEPVAAAYRPRHPERTPFYRILGEHFDDYVYAHEERFEPRSGPMRPVVRPTVEAFLDCLPRACRRAAGSPSTGSGQAGRVRPDPLPLLSGRAPAGLLMPDPQLLSQLPGQPASARLRRAGARRPVRREAQPGDPPCPP